MKGLVPQGWSQVPRKEESSPRKMILEGVIGLEGGWWSRAEKREAGYGVVNSSVSSGIFSTEHYGWTGKQGPGHRGWFVMKLLRLNYVSDDKPLKGINQE